MTKQSGKAQAAPPKEGIELQIEGMMFNILMAMEKRINECIANFVPPVPAAPLAPAAVPEKSVKTDEEKRIDEINRKRLAAYGKTKAAERAHARELDKKAFAQFQEWQKSQEVTDA
jgi:hypothetical protein